MSKIDIKTMLLYISKDDMDVCKTSIVKYKIKLSDHTPFEERFRCIPPGMYKEFMAHILEMLDVSTIYTFHSQWSIAVMLVRKKGQKT